MSENTIIRPPASGAFGKFLLVAIVVSIVLHGIFVWWALGYEPPRFGETYYEQLVPRKFRVERVEIDPAALEDTEPASVPDQTRVVPVDLPPETVAMDRPSDSSPAPTKLDAGQLNLSDPLPVSEFASTLESVQSSTGGDMVAELEDIRRQLVESDSTSPARPILPLPEQMNGEEGGLSGPGFRLGRLQGYSELDDLLSRTGPLSQGTAPIFMPGDLLFEYDEAELRGGALDALRKLGTLIQRNPRTTFLIEGHTDSFGNPDYNLGLSERRAAAVKDWLVGEMGIAPERIRTRGLGDSRLVAPATETIEGQRLNRRVEIVLEVPD